MALKDWDLNEQGDLAMGALMGFETATARGEGLMRLVFAMTQEEYENGGRAAQVHMTVRQLRGMSQALTDMADTLDAQAKG